VREVRVRLVLLVMEKQCVGQFWMYRLEMRELVSLERTMK